MRSLTAFFWSAAFFLCVTACSSCGQQQDVAFDPLEQRRGRDSTEQLQIERQRNILKKERERMAAYCSEQGWQTRSTGTGLRYELFSSGSHSTAKSGQRVRVYWTHSLLDGTSLNGTKGDTIQWRIDEEQAPLIGLHELAKLLCTGDSARFVMPAHLAYGVAGKSGKVPLRSVIAGRVKMLQILP